MASISLLYTALCLYLVPLLALAERGRYYDELLWSKQYWPEYKLDFPYYSLLKLDKGFLDTYEESLKGGDFESTSLGGGFDDLLGFLESEALRCASGSSCIVVLSWNSLRLCMPRFLFYLVGCKRKRAFQKLLFCAGKMKFVPRSR